MFPLWETITSLPVGPPFPRETDRARCPLAREEHLQLIPTAFVHICPVFLFRIGHLYVHGSIVPAELSNGRSHQAAAEPAPGPCPSLGQRRLHGGSMPRAASADSHSVPLQLGRGLCFLEQLCLPANPHGKCCFLSPPPRSSVPTADIPGQGSASGKVGEDTSPTSLKPSIPTTLPGTSAHPNTHTDGGAEGGGCGNLRD